MEEVVIPEVVPSNMPIAEEPLKVDLEAIKKWVEDQVAMTADIIPTEENKSKAKEVRATLADFSKKLNTAKKTVKDKLLAPYQEYANKIDGLIAIVEAKRIPLDEKIKAIENAMKEKQASELKEYLRALVNDSFTDTAFRDSEFWKNYITNNPKLVNLSTSLKKAKSEIAKTIEDAVRNLDVIRATFTAKGPEIVAKAEVAFARNFDLNATLHEVNSYIREQELIERRAAERKAREEAEEAAKRESAPQVLPPPIIVEERPITPADAPLQPKVPRGGKKYYLTIKVTANIPQLKSLKEFLSSNGIDYEKIGEPEEV